MAQISLRIPDELADDLKSEARNQKLSLNGYLTFVLRTATDPEFAGNEADQLRDRFRRAGMLSEWSKPIGERASREELAEARRKAGEGANLSDLVAEDRG